VARKQRHPRRHAAPVIAAAVTGAVLAGTVAFAVIPDAGGVIHGCRNKDTGALRVINYPTQRCSASETGLPWNQVGPVGPAGPAGVSGYEVRYALSATDTTPVKWARADCTPGKKAVGGGAFTGLQDSTSLSQSFVQSRFNSDGQGIAENEAWEAWARRPDDGVSWRLTVQAICVSIG
jgi:hypothetical protein